MAYAPRYGSHNATQPDTGTYLEPRPQLSYFQMLTNSAYSQPMSLQAYSQNAIVYSSQPHINSTAPVIHPIIPQTCQTQIPNINGNKLHTVKNEGGTQKNLTQQRSKTIG
jgi:hypothetical protein